MDPRLKIAYLVTTLVVTVLSLYWLKDEESLETRALFRACALGALLMFVAIVLGVAK